MGVRLQSVGIVLLRRATRLVVRSCNASFGLVSLCTGDPRPELQHDCHSATSGLQQLVMVSAILLLPQST